MTNPEDYSPNSIILTVKDPKKSIAFWRDKMGFTLRECWPSENDPKWASLVFDRQIIMLGALMSGDDLKACGHDEGAMKYAKTLEEEFKTNKPGVGIMTYIKVDDLDGYHDRLVSLGVQNMSEPKDQFYGIREFAVQDPDGFRFMFYKPIQMESCQSCGMPLANAHPGQMYCQYCTDEKGHLRPYEQVFEGTVSGYFMGMQKMERKDAEKAAKEHLSKMPAWVSRN